MQVFIYCKITVHVPGVHHAYLFYIFLFLFLYHAPSSNLCALQYDLYQRLQLQFYVLLMMGTMDTQNM
jgi:hypothetical protein